MQVKVNNIDIVNIDGRYARDLINEINKATGGNLFYTTDYPALKKLYKLMDGVFNSSVNGVHFIDSRSNE